MIDKLASGRYDTAIADYYRTKVFEIKENNVRSEIDGLMKNYEDLGREQLEELIKKLSSDKYPGHLTYAPVKTLTDALNNYEANEAAKVFDGVEFATAEQLRIMKHAIECGSFSDEILEPYIAKVEKREQDILNEELDDMCANIDSMTQEELDKLKTDISDSDKDYDPERKEKYLDRIAQRVVELKNSELAELCKYIFSMEQPELDELKTKLAGENYEKEFTAVYFKKIEEREHELLLNEIDNLCGDLNEKDIPELEKLKETILGTEKYASAAEKYAASIDNRIASVKTAKYRKIIDSAADMTAEQLAEFRRNAEEKRSEIGEQLYERSMEAADRREDALETEKIERIAGNISEYDFEKAEAVRSELANGSYSPEKAAAYIEKIDEKIYELHEAELRSYTDGADNMDKEQLIQAQIKIQEYGRDCPAELKQTYSRKIEKAMSEIADKEVRELCGNIESLTAKKSAELIRRLNTMPLDEDAKNRYIDALDAHITSIRKEEANDYIWHLSGKMDEFGINAIHFCVPSLSNLFHSKYDAACNTYISPGRYELPILLHEGNNGDSFTITTEYMHIFSRGVMNRVKIDDIASFQAKKSLMSSVLTAVEKNGNNIELPNSLNKNIVENAAKVLTSLVNYIHDKRSAEHMKELLENAVQEKAAQTPAAAPVQEEPAAPAAPTFTDITEVSVQQNTAEEIVETAPKAEHFSEELPAAPKIEEIGETAPKTDEVKEEAPKMRFCDQCGAKITSPNAKFCSECGNKLS